MSSDHSIVCDLYGLPASIKADPAALDRMLTNLLSNAVKYSPDKPDIHVRAYGEGDKIVIQVRDSGVGIDENDLPKMFARFFRAKTATGIQGTGIGLNFTKKLVELHEGEITVQSKPAEGTTFTITLPVDGPAEDRNAA